MTPVQKASRVVFRIEEWEWADSMVWGRPSQPPEPTIEVGDVIETQLWMSLEHMPDVRESPVEMEIVDSLLPRVVVRAPVSRAGMWRPSIGLLLLAANLPVIVAVSNTNESAIEGVQGRTVSADGILYGSVTTWTAPFFTPVLLRVEGIHRMPDESRRIDSVPVEGSPKTRVSWGSERV